MKAINSIVRDNRRVKIKKWSCKCTTSTAQINDFVLLCQPLTYDLTSSTLHTSVTWYLHSTSNSSKHPNEADDTERDEWGVVGENLYYKWPLYQWTTIKENDDDYDNDLEHTIIHKYFDGEVQRKSTPLIMPLPHSFTKDREKLMFLCMIHMPLTNNDDVVDNDDDDGFHGVHTFEDEANVMTISNIAIFCSRGISANCKCTQVRLNELMLRKTKVNERYPIKGIFLYKWPYDDHGMRQQDQLSNIMTSKKMKSSWKWCSRHTIQKSMQT